MGKDVERECPICGTEYTADSTRLKHGRQTTCSRECSYKLRGKKMSKSKTLECATCGEKVERAPSELEQVRHDAVYCSRECHYKGRSLGHTPRVVDEPYDLTEEGREALREAAQKRATPKEEVEENESWGEDGNLYKEPVRFECEECGEEVVIPRGEYCPAHQNRFCSHECANKNMNGEQNPAWRGGHEGYYGANWEEARCEARKRDEYTCQDCGTTEDELGKQLDVHHITAFRSYDDPEEANNLDNLVSLCHPCHMEREWESR